MMAKSALGRLFSALSGTSDITNSKRSRSWISLVHCLIQATKIAIAIYFFLHLPNYLARFCTLIFPDTANAQQTHSLNAFSITNEITIFILNKLFYILFYSGNYDVNNIFFVFIENIGDIFIGTLFYQAAFNGKNITKHMGLGGYCISDGMIAFIPTIYNAINQLVLALFCIIRGDILQSLLLLLLTIRKRGSVEAAEDKVLEIMQSILPDYICKILSWISDKMLENVTIFVVMIAYTLISTSFRFSDKTASISFLCNHFLFTSVLSMHALGAIEHTAAFSAASTVPQRTYDSMWKTFALGKTDILSVNLCSIVINILFTLMGGASGLISFVARKFTFIHFHLIKNSSEPYFPISIRAFIAIALQLMMPLIFEIFFNIYSLFRPKASLYAKYSPAIFPYLFYLGFTFAYSMKNGSLNEVFAVVSVVLSFLISMFCIGVEYIITKKDIERMDRERFYARNYLSIVSNPTKTISYRIPNSTGRR